MHRGYAIYARQSIDKADSISIDTQIERCLFEVGTQPYKIYSDRGYSGKNTDRPQFQQMLNDLRSGYISCVVCYKLDRCSRSILDFTQLMSLFQQYDVAFISCTEKFDTATPMGRAMLNICIVFAQLERETIQQRITDAYHSRCKKGYFMGGRVPFGFSLAPYILEGKKTSCYAVVDKEADILRRIYSIYSEPSASLSDVVLGLNAANTPNPRRPDGHWIRPHIARMIKNPIYVMADEQIYDFYLLRNVKPDNPREDYIGQNGCYLYKIEDEQHLVLAPHRGIVSSEVWLKCQRSRQHGKSVRKNETVTSWLTGKLKCHKCGKAVVARQTVGRNNQIYRYFLCSGSRGRARICEGFKPFSAPKTESAIENAIVTHLHFLIEPESNCDSKTNTTHSLREMLQNLYDSLETPDTALSQLEQTLFCLRQQLKSQTDKGPVTYRRKQKQKDLLTKIISDWDNIPQQKKCMIADLLIEKMELTDLRIIIQWRV